jgi:Methane oxygenase PmoA
MRCRCFIAFCLMASPPFARAGDVTAVVDKDGVEFRSGSTVVAKYATDPKYAKPFLYPLFAPNGVPVTRGWPMEKAPPMGTTDHVHQKSVWFCHGDVIPEGIELKTRSPNKADKGVDFWSEAKNATGRHGTIRCVKLGKPVQHAANHASIETHNEWYTPDGIKILDEVRIVHFVDNTAGRLFAFEITLRAAVCPITFGDTKEGSFGIRVRDELRGERRKNTLGGDGVMTNADGKVGEKEIWGQPSDWVHYAGSAEGKEIGVAVFNHPSNPRPAWHARAYGLVAANPFGRDHSGFPSQKGKTDLLKIEKGGEMKLKYAVYAHAGDVRSGKVVEAYEEFKK